MIGGSCPGYKCSLVLLYQCVVVAITSVNKKSSTMLHAALPVCSKHVGHAEHLIFNEKQKMRTIGDVIDYVKDFSGRYSDWIRFHRL